MDSSEAHFCQFRSSVDHERRRQRTDFSGRIHLNHIEAYVTSLVDDGTLSYTKIIDARSATTEISAHDVHRLVEILVRLSKGERLGQAAVLVADSATYGMARVMSVLIEGTLSIQPFREIEEAESWLGWIDAQ